MNAATERHSQATVGYNRNSAYVCTSHKRVTDVFRVGSSQLVLVQTFAALVAGVTSHAVMRQLVLAQTFAALVAGVTFLAVMRQLVLVEFIT